MRISRWAAVLAAVAVLAGCGEGVGPGTRQRQSAGAVTDAKKQANITALCDAWTSASSAQLATPEQEGRFNVLKSEPGIPSDMTIAVNAFYRQTSIKDDPQGLRRAYDGVVDACNRSGWPF